MNRKSKKKSIFVLYIILKNEITCIYVYIFSYILFPQGLSMVTGVAIPGYLSFIFPSLSLPFSCLGYKCINVMYCMVLVYMISFVLWLELLILSCVWRVWPPWFLRHKNPYRSYWKHTLDSRYIVRFNLKIDTLHKLNL